MGAFLLSTSAFAGVSGGVNLASDYFFRGVSQTQGESAVQWNLEAEKKGVYGGTWGSQVDFGGEASIEYDFYGGYRWENDKVGVDAGVIQYNYNNEVDSVEEWYGILSVGMVSLGYWRDRDNKDLDYKQNSLTKRRKTMTEEQQGNSNEVSQEGNQTFDSGDFFNSLEDSVNGIVSDGEDQQQTTQVTQPDGGSEQVTHNTSQGSNVDWENENNPYKKRYKDSSREAVKMNTAITQLKPFVPVLEAMKRDSGLVDHVRDYLKSGGAPNKTIQDQLNLSEDFIYDPQEAMTDPKSDSAKVQQAHIDTVVQERVNQVLAREKKGAAKMQQKFVLKKQAADFMKRHNMTPEQFGEFQKAASQKRMTLDDAYYILNKDRTAANVANNTKSDMLTQMKNVRNIPATASDSNNQGTSQQNPDDKLFDSMVGSDSDVDNLFG